MKNTRIYTYGVCPPHKPSERQGRFQKRPKMLREAVATWEDEQQRWDNDAKVLWDQIRKGHKFYNDLIAIEREARQKRQEHIRSINPKVEKILTAIEALNEQIKEKRVLLGPVLRKDREGHPLTLEIQEVVNTIQGLWDDYREETRKIWESPKFLADSKRFDEEKASRLWEAIPNLRGQASGHRRRQRARSRLEEDPQEQPRAEQPGPSGHRDRADGEHAEGLPCRAVLEGDEANRTRP